MERNTYKKVKTTTFFGQLEKKLQGNTILLGNFSSYYLLRLLYIFFLVLMYVWNTHYHEKTLYKINQLQPRVDGLRVRYMEVQAKYMFTSKQSEIASKVAAIGIYESKIPPYTIKAE